MKYPKIWTKCVNALGLASGVLTLVIAVLSLLEAILRYFLSSPTSWTLTVSQYILLYVVFFASPYAFQEGGHVAVDMVLMAADKIDHSGKQRLRRVLTSIGYAMAAVFIFVIARGTWQLLSRAIATNQKTVTAPVIPIDVLYIPMLIGCVLMLLTLVFMILDCWAKDHKSRYLQ